MDVRCGNCQTEYELDDARVTGAGVTVKCSTCGHIFRVRRAVSPVTRGSPPSAETLAVPAADTPPRAAEPAPAACAPVEPAAPAIASEAPASSQNGPDEAHEVAGAPPEAGERVWLIRGPQGEVRRFRELTTLQQWIVERKVTRDYEISRTGETWKRLGDIAELASFFHVVDQAVAAAEAGRKSSSPRKATLPYQQPAVGLAAAASGSRSGLAPVCNTLQGVPAAVPPAAAFKPPAVAAEPPAVASKPPAVAAEPPVAASKPPAVVAEPPAAVALPAAATGVAAEPSREPSVLSPSETTRARPGAKDASMHTGGMASRVDDLGDASTLEPAWAGSSSRLRPPDDALSLPAMVRGGVPTTPFGDIETEHVRRPQRSQAPWVIAVLIVLAGGGIGTYFALTAIRRQKPSPSVSSLSVSKLDADTPSPSDAAPAAVPVAQNALDEALAALDRDTDQDYAAAEQKLAAAQAADPDAFVRIQAAQALVASTWAQSLTEDAEDVAATATPADRRRAEQLRAEAARKLQRADEFARQAFARAPKDPDVVLAVADVRRQQPKAKLRDVAKLLEGVEASPAKAYVFGMVRLREGDRPGAIAALTEAADKYLEQRGRELVRARYHLARIALDDGRLEDANTILQALLVAAPDHARGRALATRIAALLPATAVVDAAPAGGSVGVGPGDQPAGGDYDALAARANGLAENGHCAEAIKLFEQALDQRPGGVEALTGLGYCYLDAGQHGVAQAKFRAALGVSARYGDALFGIAEAYRYQGQKTEAAEYFQRYLDANPNGPKAVAARRYVGELKPQLPTTPNPGGTGASDGDKHDAPPADKPEDRPADKPEDKPADKPEDKPADKPEDKPADPPADQPAAPAASGAAQP